MYLIPFYLREKLILKAEDLKEADTDISSVIKFNNHAETVQRILDVVRKKCGWNRLYHLEFGESGKNSLCHATPAHDSRCIYVS